MEVQTAPSSSILRRSCHFCRGRKIRCSGSSICSACQERNIDCVYDVQSGKGRPKGRGSKSSKVASSAARSKQSATDESSNGAQHQKSLVGHLPIQTIEQALNIMFEENFTESGPKSSDPFQNTIADFSRQLRQDPMHVREICGYSLNELDRDEAIPYDNMLSCIRGEMMAMIASRFGSLGCELKESGSRLSYLRGLLVDNSSSMFDASYQGEDPLSRLDHHRVLQLIDTWFANHPLSPLISKTLLLTSLKSNTADKALLAFIIGDSLTAHGNAKLFSSGTENQDTFFQYAITLLKHRPASSFKITTVQAFCLLGFRELCSYNNRRATCWLGLASRAVAELDEQMRLGELRNHQRMNGVEVGTVDREIVRNMHWITFATTFWAKMQIGAPFSSIVPNSFSIDFPPVNESFSAVIGLDMASDNISTVLAQSRSLREFWPLSHIVCSMTHICALDTHLADVEDGSDGAAWQSKHLLKLRRLLSVDTEVSAVCTNVCDILHEATQEVEREVQDSCPRSIVTCAYRTIIIQLLFPRSAETVVTTKMVHDLCQVMAGIPEIARSITKAILNPGPVPRELISTSPVAETLALCLDACARALLRLCDRATSGTDSEYLTIAEYRDQLSLYAAQLHEISKLDLSRTVSFIRPVKRRLKEAKFAFTAYATIRNRGVRANYSMSATSSPQMSLHHMVGSSASLADLPAFIPSLDYSAPNSGVGTPVLESVPMSMYNSPMLSTAIPHHEQPMSDGYFGGVETAVYGDPLASAYHSYIPSLPTGEAKLDHSAWLFIPPQSEPTLYTEKGLSAGRTSITSAPADMNYLHCGTQPMLTAEPLQYGHEEARYW